MLCRSRDTVVVPGYTSNEHDPTTRHIVSTISSQGWAFAQDGSPQAIATISASSGGHGTIRHQVFF
jgi:hypothetical protein